MIFLFTGKARHGKDTCADHIAKKLPKCVKLSFAKYLKMYAKDYLGWDGGKDKRGRTLLQKFGTDYIRVGLENPDFHVNRVAEDIEILSGVYDHFVVADCRFENEHQVLVDRFGKENVKLIKVVRPQFESELNSTAKGHASETSMDNYEGIDYEVENIDLFVTWNALNQIIYGLDIKPTFNSHNLKIDLEEYYD